jgi:hypothetical protein
MLDYTFSNDILFAKSTGDNTISDIIGHYDRLARSDEYSENLKVLIDIREVNLNVNPEELSAVRQSLIQSVENLGVLYEAILVKEPYETAIATLFEREFNDIGNYTFKVFYTEHAALSWLKEF